MKNLSLAALAATIILALAACAPPAQPAPNTPMPNSPTTPTASPTPDPRPPAPIPSQFIRADKQRAIAPAVTLADRAALATGNTAFAFDLYQSLRQTDGNLFYSPYSISLALAMTYSGAKGATAQQMASALRFTLPPTQLHPAFNTLDQALAQRGQGAQGQDGKGFRLKIANAIWGQDDYTFQPDFLNTLAENYGAGLRVLDFKQTPDPARLNINNWVSDQTEGKIKDLIPAGAIDPLTRLVLTNAIYFNAAWSQPFNKASTADGPFTLRSGSPVNVPLMTQLARFNYADGAGYQAVELPYDGRQLSMVVLLPAAGQFDAFEQSLSGAQVESVVKALSAKQVALTMPRFKTESAIALRDPLTALGMKDAFAPGVADFSGINGNRDLYVSSVVHKAFVNVDEAGTEAAAATAVIVGVTSAIVDPPVIVRIDRPFIFLIRDLETGAVLFVGRIVDASR